MGMNTTFILMDRIIQLHKKYVLGDPKHPDTTLGPMAHERFADKVREHLAEAGKFPARIHASDIILILYA